MSKDTRFVLFDLDGTLVDTAPDLAGAANALRAEEGLQPLPPETLRPVCSAGARGLLAQAFGVHHEDDAFPRLRERFLALYLQRLADESAPFPGIAALLDALDDAGLCWGIVTNKPRAYTEPLIDALGWAGRSAVVVAGDDAPQPKPAPDPLHLACSRLDRDAAHGIYLGDDPRDIASAQAVPMRCAAVSWGYIEHAPPIRGWGADAVFDSAEQAQRYLLD